MTEPFDAHRRLLFRVAYDLLGSVADAEDVVQDTWLRWSAADRSPVRDPRAYLVRTVTNQALNRLRTAAATRETYLGPWLPEPLVEPDPADDVTDRLDREQDVSLALLVVLETLSPAERAVFVLREVFGMSHDEVAAALDRTPAAVRQLAHRAREHVQARRPRFEADAAQQRRVTEQFLAACATGDLARLLALLAPDVTLVSDGGGVVSAARRPVLGADKVARFLLGVAAGVPAESQRLVRVNGRLGLAGFAPDGATGYRAEHVTLLDVVDGRIGAVLVVRNPAKLMRVTP
ncbi:RNA polymerase sigma-70 factor, ECF subfamily [Jatrophihabitans endophyticus]|uniref:RNA polymerase sigma-70 factor, ECF subfamily n=1 Tax=Jatrophihabitans endophyticus TaxID=1206085 RepID=A0A1M5ICR2_9ACTN|nr:RNA polymerase sigma factor SigJ [Jatrophihabitans endophyticus]SHG25690.1 RNA polymerase sigma-70 factor, ECF subfamily [Jatrophihabitans endophyticus]